MFKQKDVLIILWMTFITTVAWIGFNIYHAIVTSTISEELQMQILPIDPNFDMATINKLKSREKIEPLYKYQGSYGEASSAAAVSVTPTIGLSPVEDFSSTQSTESISPSVTLAPEITGTP